MPAGVIDITKYAMADRSQRVLVRTTAAQPTRIQLHPSRTLRKILGKSRPRVSACRWKIDSSPLLSMSTMTTVSRNLEILHTVFPMHSFPHKFQWSDREIVITLMI